MAQQQGVVAPDALRRALELSMAATAGDAEDDLQRALALSRAEAGIEAPPSAANPPVDLASALAAARAASAPEDELERALAASRADNDAALVAECRAVDAARVAAEADAEALAERRAAEERERETLVISGVGERGGRRPRRYRRVDGRAGGGALRATRPEGAVRRRRRGGAARRGEAALARAERGEVVSSARAGRPAGKSGHGVSLVDVHAGPGGRIVRSTPRWRWRRHCLPCPRMAGTAACRGCSSATPRRVSSTCPRRRVVRGRAGLARSPSAAQQPATLDTSQSDEWLRDAADALS